MTTGTSPIILNSDSDWWERLGNIDDASGTVSLGLPAVMLVRYSYPDQLSAGTNFRS